MNVRDASDDDLPALVEIYNHAVVHGVATFDLAPFSVDARKPWFSQFGPDNPLLVAEDTKGIAGYAYYLPYRAKPGYASTKETTVYVAPARRGRGIGNALYAALFDRARSAGVHLLVAVIAGENPASVALHRRFGFVEVGTLREAGRKFDRWVDTTLYQVLL